MPSTRRSGRLEAKAPSTSQHAPNSVHAQPNSDVDMESDAALTTSRKRKVVSDTTAPPPKRKKGKLSGLLTMMPNEVISEVCSYLHPVDLLHLVQSSKIFALFLLRTPGTWRFGRLQLDDLPEPPEDLTEQQYACLLFGTNCQNCGTMCRISKHTLAWGIRRRWCEKCRDRVAAGKDKKYIISKNNDKKCRMMLRSTLITKTQHTTVIHRTHYDTVLAEIQERQGNEQSMREYTESREEIIQQEIKRRDAILEWLNSRDSDRSEELRGVRVQRLQDLKGYLEKTGYSARILALIHDREYERFPTMQQSKRLTPQAWEKCEPLIIPALECALVPVHSKAIREAQKKFGLILQSAMKECSDYLDYVPHRHAFGWAQFPTTIEEALREWALPEENCVRLHQSWLGQEQEEILLPDHIIELAISFLADSRRRVRELFVSLIRSSGRFPHTFEAPETLELATCVFSRVTSSGSYIRDCIALPYWLTHRLDRSGLSWNNGGINLDICDWVLDVAASGVFHQIITQAGGDPNTCTREAFLNMAEHVSCLLCDEDNTMHLEASAFHWSRSHAGQDPSTGSWRLLTPTDSASLCTLWVNGLRIQNKGPVYACLLCIAVRYSQYSGRSYEETIQHIKSTHKDVGSEGNDLAKFYRRVPTGLVEKGVTWNPPKEKAQSSIVDFFKK